MVPEDAERKFTSTGNIQKWVHDRFDTDDPMINWLQTDKGELAGIAYIENAFKNKNNGAKIFGVRVYEGFEGSGNAKLLSLTVHERFDEVLPGRLTQFKMHMKNNGGFVIGAMLGYQLSHNAGNEGQKYIRNPR